MCTYQSIADGANEDEDCVDDSQAGETETVEGPVLVVLLH